MMYGRADPMRRKTEPLRGLVSLWSRPGFLVRRLHQISVSIFADEMDDLELTPVQFGAMSIIGVNPGIDQSALGEELGTDRANTADVVTRLVKNGLALRTVFPEDRRVRRIYLTEQGSDLVLEANGRLKQIQARLLAPLKPQDRASFVELMSELIEANNSLGRTALRLKSR